MREQMENLKQFVAEQRKKFDERLEEFGATGLMSWDDKSWTAGEKGVAWLRQAKNASIAFENTKIKGLEPIEIEHEYSQFMRAVVVMDTFRRSKEPSAATTEKISSIMRRWYYEMVQMTGQTHPMYLNSNIIHAAMKRHYDNSKSPTNVSDYCDVAVSLAKLIRPLNLTLANIACENKFPKRNASVHTKNRRIADMNPDNTDDEKLITIRTFMSIIELIFLAKTDGEKIALNALLLLIITGWRFQELQSVRVDALKKRYLTGDKLLHTRENGLPEFNLGIRYLGAKKAGWRVFWAAPSTIPLIESIFEAVKELTADSRELIKQYRESEFTDFLPPSVKALPYESVEISELNGHMFAGTGGVRGNSGLRKSMVNAFTQKGVKISPTVEEGYGKSKRFMFTKEQINRFVEQKYIQEKGFHDGHKCTLVVKDNGVEQKFNYEDLLFIVPVGAFGIEHTLVTLTNPVPLSHATLQAWLGGNPQRKSIFEKLGLTEDDGGRIALNPHVPRHNINTFLAIAGVTDHLQAMLMGRMDITQNTFYQHRAESQGYGAASLAAMALQKSFEADKDIQQLSLFDTTTGDPALPLIPKASATPSGTAVSRRINALAKKAKSKPRSGVDAVKISSAILVDPKLSMEHNLKQNMHTVGETRSEVANYIENTMSDDFLPELKQAHAKLLAQKKNAMAKELIERHAKLHSLEIGSCTRDVGRWGCPHAMKCQSGLPCGYFTLTGRMDELDAVTRRLHAKQEDVLHLEKLCETDPSFELALEEQQEALVLLEAFQNKVIASLKGKQLVSLLSSEKDNPLAKLVERIQEQTAIGKVPNTLADMFFIEQKRMERNAMKEDAASE